MPKAAIASSNIRVARSFQTQARVAVGLKKSMFQPTHFSGFHVSAMSFDAEVNNDAPVEAEPMAPPAPAGGSKLYVGNLSWNIGSEDVRAAFTQYGEVLEADVVIDPTGRSRGFAFVTMVNSEDCTAAIEGENGKEMDGRAMRVDFHTPRDPNAPRPERRSSQPSRDDPNRIYVGNLPWSFDDFDLQDTFDEFGTVVDAKVITDRETGRSRGFGFVTMASDDDVESAIRELDGSQCDGRYIRVNRAER